MSKVNYKKEMNDKANKPTADKLSDKFDKATKLDDSVEEYTEKEIEYLDRYKAMTGDLMDDDEIYEIITNYNFDDTRIKREIKELMNIIQKKGVEYSWNKIENGKSMFTSNISKIYFYQKIFEIYFYQIIFEN